MEAVFEQHKYLLEGYNFTTTHLFEGGKTSNFISEEKAAFWAEVKHFFSI